ncbi:MULTISPECIES: PhoH family protein [unclassified Luteimonas]|uniref:PhoH family protein n=1 Tax=unclassified Luteimonas TaxID=2629088 RepID=UPI0018F0E496|nr:MULTISPECIES: PhoH family protein [unclassified Luteimonas]MBJ6978762.1 PhoH family protein [Luteimonas sp. MC1895]MBJ6983662.1 PhoH family protein [Luteimonas sp. MC1750]QQO06503.1 PhoH family protein [Luteimonas sp. MC1750]
MPNSHQRDFTLEPADTERLANLGGPFDAHLRQIELALGVEIANRGNIFRVSGDDGDRVDEAERLLRDLYEESASETFDAHAINLRVNASRVVQSDTADGAAAGRDDADFVPQTVAIRVKRGTIRGRGPNQQKYLHAIATHDINFGIGPAGTGKTFLAVASAVEALNESRVQRLVLVRPAVEAGEKLGFLPGDLSQKVDPYLRPLYDALYEMLGVEKVLKLLEKNVIEIAPLAYMRGRTLNDAYVILDEAQNTTIEQMKMFLTRLGFGSTAVVTGDLTQIDLPKSMKSGLRDALEVLRDVDGVSFTFFESRDVVRHPLVARIVNAYDRRDAEDASTGPA